MSSAEVACATPPMRSATAVALSGLTSLTATTRPPAMTVWMRSMCACPMPPGPIIPMRTVTVRASQRVPRPSEARYSRVWTAMGSGAYLSQPYMSCSQTT